MTDRKPTRMLLELREAAVDMLKNTPQARAVDFETIEAVESASTPRQLIFVLNGTITRYGISGDKERNLREIVHILENLKG